MGLLTRSLFFCFAYLILFSSCDKEENYVKYIPNDASSLGKLNVPALKSKALTWDLIYNHLFSSESEESTDWGVDIDRSIYFYQSNSNHFQLLVPLNSADSFKNALKENLALNITTINQFSVANLPVGDRFSLLQDKLHLPLAERIFMGWDSDVLIISTQETYFKDLALNPNHNQYLQKIIDSDDDLTIRATQSELFNDSAYVSIAGNFNDGNFVLDLEGSNHLEKSLDSIFIPSPTKKNFSFFTDSCIAGLSTKANIYYLDLLVQKVLPEVKDFHVLLQDQYEVVKPYLDGRVYLGVSEIKLQTGVIPEVKVCFGLNPDYKLAADTTFLKEFESIENGSPYHMNKQTSQFLFPGEDFIVFSNHSEEDAIKETKNTIFNLQLNKSAINEKLMRLASIFYGKEIVEKFPIEEVNIDIHHSKGESIEGKLILDFQNKEDNSLIELINYLYLFQNRDEI